MEVLHPVQNESLPPKIVSESFPLLTGDTIKHIDKILLLSHPDIEYDIYIDERNNRLFTHVATDHPDPKRDGEQLQVASEGSYSFKDIVTPGSEEKTISIVDNDDFKEEFFIKDGNIYHYVANTESYSAK